MSIEQWTIYQVRLSWERICTHIQFTITNLKISNLHGSLVTVLNAVIPWLAMDVALHISIRFMFKKINANELNVVITFLFCLSVPFCVKMQEGLII